MLSSFQHINMQFLLIYYYAFYAFCYCKWNFVTNFLFGFSLLVCINTMSFCIKLILDIDLCPITLLKSLLVLIVFWWILLDFQNTKSCHLGIETVLLFPVLYNCLFFFNCLDGISNAMLNEVARMDILVLFLILERKHTIF